MYYIPYLISWSFLISGLFFAKTDNIQILITSGLFMIAAMIAYKGNKKE